MSGRLVPCPTCNRHVRAGAGACPFCLAAHPADLEPGPAPVPPPVGLSRIELYRYGTRGARAIAGAVVGTSMLATASCGNDQYIAAYGIACFDCGSPNEDALVLADAQVAEGGDDAAEDVSSHPDGGADVESDAPKGEAGRGGDGSTDTGTPPSDAAHGG